jgi:hypothetical protein
MPGTESISSRIAGWSTEIRRWTRPWTSHLVVYLGAILAGGLLATAATSVEPADRLIVGNTGGTLTTLIEVDRQRVLIGGGPSRSHSADLLGRSTRPWDNDVDLLIVPGWDEHHAVGALGLLERESVRSIAVAGLPGEAPVWTLLEREAQNLDVPVRFLSGGHTLNLSDSVALTTSSLMNEADGLWVRLEHSGKRVDIVEADDAETAFPDPRELAQVNNHVMISTRNQAIPADMTPMLHIFPRPFWQQDFLESGSPHQSAIDRNEHIVMELDDQRMRLPLDQVETPPD